MRSITCAMLAMTCVVSGCQTALVSSRVEEKSKVAPNGLMYRLPTKQFDLAVTYELVSCAPTADGTVELGAKVTGTVAERVVGDDKQTYFLDYNELDAWTKVSQVEIGVTDTGLLTSINSSMTDQTGPIIANAGAATFNVLRAAALTSVTGGVGTLMPLRLQQPVPSSFLSSGVVLPDDTVSGADKSKATQGAVPRARKKGPKVERIEPTNPLEALCETFKRARQDYLDAGKAAKTAATFAKARTDDLDTLTRRTALHAQLKEDLSFYKQYGTPAQIKAATEAVATSARSLADAQAIVEASKLADADLEKKNKAVADAKAKLFIDNAITFSPSRGDECKDERLQFVGINALFDPSIFPCSNSDQKNCVALPTVRIAAKPVAGYAAESVGFKDGKVGLAYRLPASAELTATANPGGNEFVFLKQLVQVPQYGHVASLDLSNGAFADNMLKITFSANGAPTQLTFSSKSQGEAASKAAAQTAQSYFDFAKGKQQDKIDAAKTQIGLDKDRASANAAIATDNLTTLRQIQQLQALANGSSSEATNQLDALNHQRDMLEAQLKILALQKQINDAKASLAAPSGQ